jgi:hypothetical protein
MFVQENSTVDVVIYYKKLKYRYDVYSEAAFKKEKFSDEEKEKFKKITIKMKQLSWGLYNELQEGAVDVDDEGTRNFNYKRYKESRLLRLISSWDATTLIDGEDVVVRVNEKSVKSLAPEIAESILTSYDDLAFLSEEEEGK